MHRDGLLDWLNGEPSKAKRTLGFDDENEFDKKNVEKQLITKEIESALDKIDHGEFGKCTLCNGEIEEERLALDFTTCVCLDHYSDNQIKQLEYDLELAAKVQKQLFPQEIPSVDGIQLAVRAEPSRIVGGDYFDFFIFRGNLPGFAVADVMGKGLPASMLMSNLQASLRILGPENTKLDKTLLRLNELFRFNLKTIKFITMFMAAINIEKKELEYSNAGHNPPLWFKKNTNEFEFLNPTGPALGVFSEPDFASEIITYNTGDFFLFYTDGLTEANNGQDEFGEERLQKHLYEHRNETAQHILTKLFQAVKDFSSEEMDDLTAILIKID